MHANCKRVLMGQESKPNRSSSQTLLPNDPPNEPDMNPRLLGEEGKLSIPAPASVSTPAIPTTGQYSAGADPTVNGEVLRPITSTSCPPAYCVNSPWKDGDGELLDTPSCTGGEEL